MPEPTPLYSLIYRSQASRAVHEVTLTSLLRKARQYNEQAQLTGLLLFTKGHFLQLLEGPEPALSDLYARINDDPRHYDVRTLAYGPIEKRAFPHSPLAYAPVEPAFVEKAAHCLPSTTVGLTPAPCDEVYQLLRTLAQSHAQIQ